MHAPFWKPKPARRSPRRVTTGTVVGCVWVLAAGGCGALDAYEAARAALPADQFVQLNGQWVHFVRTGAGEPVVLIHGFAESTYVWRNVQLELAGAFDVIAVDLNGFGYTERPASPGAYSLIAQANLVRALLDDFDLAAVRLVGHSYGAAVALTLAVEEPQRVRGLVVVDGVPSGGLDRIPPIAPLVRPLLPWWTVNYVLTDATVRHTLEALAYNGSFVSDEVVAGYLAPLRLEGLAEALNGLLVQLDERPVGIDPAEVAQPVLVIWGAHDPLFTLETGQELAAALADARFVSFEHSGHLPMEEEPALFAETLAAFLAE